VKPPAVTLIGKNRAETTMVTAALYCAGARIVDAADADLALVIEAKAAAQPRHLNVPLIAIVPALAKRKALAAGVDAAYSRPREWKAYSRLIGRVLATWCPTRTGSRRRRARTS
jgi:hypothetical protein